MLMGLFDRVGLQKNVRKTVGMVCRTCQADGVRAEDAYNQRMRGEELQEATELAAAVAGDMTRVREGVGKGVTIDTPKNPAQRG